MPRLEKHELLQLVLDAIRASGSSVEERSREHPFRLELTNAEGRDLVLLYVWNVSRGGRGRSEDEYRIQITGVEQLVFEDDRKTLLLGLAWVRNRPVLVAFDAIKHAEFGSSPSIQVRQQTLERALEEGIAFETKQLAGDNVEVVVAFAPELFAQYLDELYSAYHARGSEQVGLGEGSTIDALAFLRAFTDDELGAVPPRRRRVLRSVSVAVRDQQFRHKVLQVYGHRCAVCGMQGGLVAGCHIKAFAHDGPDDVRNGIALCYNCHNAFDRGLIGIDEAYMIRLNTVRDGKLREDGLADGLEDLYRRMRIGQRIHLPEEWFMPDPGHLAHDFDAKGRANFA